MWGNNMESEIPEKSDIVELGRILLADDEDTFLQSTADLLRREGYKCDCVPDADRATEMLSDNEYDLLIADIKMPGNSELEFIRDLPNIAENVPVILVTGYPLVNSAIESVKLRVEAYLVKPLDFQELLGYVHIAVEHFQVYRSVRSIKQRLRYWYDGLGDIEELLRHESQKTFSVSFNTFLELTFQSIVGAMSDLKHLTEALAIHDGRKEPCHLLNCPRLSSLSDGLVETINLLEKSKSAFKSKTLGQIRTKLDALPIATPER